MTKEEAIKEAYGEHWETVKDYVDENGWIEDLHACTCLFMDTFDGIIVSRIYFIDVEVNNQSISDFFRPKSLQGIESNNGWIKIESEEDLPKEGMHRVVFFEKGNYKNYYVYPYFELRLKYKNNEITHYKPVEIEKPPIY